MNSPYLEEPVLEVINILAVEKVLIRRHVHLKTRKHSSRMRTDRLLTVGSAVPGEGCDPGVGGITGSDIMTPPL